MVMPSGFCEFRCFVRNDFELVGLDSRAGQDEVLSLLRSHFCPDVKPNGDLGARLPTSMGNETRVDPSLAFVSREKEKHFRSSRDGRHESITTATCNTLRNTPRRRASGWGRSFPLDKKPSRRPRSEPTMTRAYARGQERKEQFSPSPSLPYTRFLVVENASWGVALVLKKLHFSQEHVINTYISFAPKCVARLACIFLWSLSLSF